MTGIMFRKSINSEHVQPRVENEFMKDFAGTSSKSILRVLLSRANLTLPYNTSFDDKPLQRIKKDCDPVAEHPVDCSHELHCGDI